MADLVGSVHDFDAGCNCGLVHIAIELPHRMPTGSFEPVATTTTRTVK